MKTGYGITASVLFLLLFSSSAPAITQLFDSDGNLMRSVRARYADAAAQRVSRHALPDGLELLRDVNYEFYPVFGKTFSEAVRSAEENGPFNKRLNRRLPSRTDWSTRLSYAFDYAHETDEESGIVDVFLHLSRVNVKPIITVTLPALLDDTSLNALEKELWKNYVRRLLDRENDHVKIIRDPDLKEAFLKSVAETDYFSLDDEFSGVTDVIVAHLMREETAAIARDWIRQLQERIEKYDRITDYGSKPGNRESFFTKNNAGSQTPPRKE